jgi:SulP family sulfate permease
MWTRLFPDLAGWRPSWLLPDAQAALAVTFLAVPQGVAYAIIAGLPPAVGLYAGAIPVILGSLLRSSSHVITGPTNALSLLAGTAIAASATDDPLTAGVILALLVGVFQASAGFLRLGAIVDYISTSVVAGYITGAGVLIGVGQLGNVTGTPLSRGDLITQLGSWIAGLGAWNAATLALALSTAALVLLLRTLAPRLPASTLALAAGVVLSALVDLPAWGVQLARDVAPVPFGLPPLSWPFPATWSGISGLAPVAVALAVLSLVETSSVARSIASRTGQRLSSDRELIGQGAANLAAAFFSGYPTSGSLSRSALNESTGAKSRLAGVFSGALMLLVILALGPLVDLTPIPSLAGLLLIIAADLVDLGKIRAILAGDLGDRFAFLTTLLGTWILPLDQAIYLGVGLSLVLFLRRARQLVVKEMIPGEGRFHEAQPGEAPLAGPIRILHIEGSLFFGAANELRDALDDATTDPTVRVLIVRLKRTTGLDYTTATVLEAAHRRLRGQNRHLLLVGLRPETMALLERVGVADAVGRERLYPTRPGWFAAMD